MRKDDSSEVPVGLNTAVIYRGKPALVVGRAKPIGLSWRYDLLLESSSDVVRGVTAAMFEIMGTAAAD